jgi:hypothetical protein
MLRPEAQQALTDLIQEYGKSIVRMPSSCQMYMTVKLAEFPEEKDLFIKALRHGVPEQILATAGTADYQLKLVEMGRDLAKGCGIDSEEAAAVVTSWASALNRPIGYQRPALPTAGDPQDEKPDPATEKKVRLVMALIAGAGGFLGTAIGSGAAMVALVLTDEALDDGSGPPARVEPALRWLLIAVKVAIAGVAGGIGGFAGWLFGRGDQKPWAGFVAAFGAGFTLGAIFLSFSGSIVRVIGVAVGVFGASFTAAARGGYKH